MITIKCTGDFTNTKKFLESAQKMSIDDILNKYGQMGVNALRQNTPKDTGKTAESWNYSIKKSSKGCSITWTNNNAPGGIPVAVLIQYGHGTKNGGYVSGVDFINPALKPIFEAISNNVWKEVNK